MIEEELLEADDEVAGEIPALAEPAAESEELLEDEFEMVTLSGRQKIWIGAATLFSFLFFAVYFLPYDLIIRYFLGQYSSSVRIDFIKFDPGLIGPDVIKELKIQVPNGASFQADTVESGLAYRDVLSNRARGNITLENLDISTASVAGNVANADIALNIRGYEEGLGRMQGSIALKTGFINLSKLPEALPLPINPKDIKIKELNLRLRANRGNLNFDGSTVRSNLFGVTIRGGGRTTGGMESLNLNVRVCIKPDARLEETNPDIFGYFSLLGGSGAAGGEKCIDLSGPLGSPQMKPVQ